MIRLLFVTLLLSHVGATVAHACSCVMPELEGAIASADAIFEGRVVSFEEGLVVMRITQEWKGVDTETLEFSAGPSLCEYPFEVGGFYLVYAEHDGSGLATHLCSRTRAISDAEEDLRALGAGITPVDPTGDHPDEAVGAAPSDDEGTPQTVTRDEEVAPRAGCASCAAGGGSRSGAALPWLLLALIWTRRRYAFA